MAEKNKPKACTEMEEKSKEICCKELGPNIDPKYKGS
jgi:hypothetical protein